MKRVNHMLTDHQLEKLNRLRKSTGLSASEIIRRALDDYTEKVERIKRPVFDEREGE